MERRGRVPGPQKCEVGDHHNDLDDDRRDALPAGKGARSSVPPDVVNWCLLAAIGVCVVIIIHLIVKFRVEALQSQRCDNETDAVTSQLRAAEGRVLDLKEERLLLQRTSDKLNEELKKWEDKQTVIHHEMEKLVTHFLKVKKDKVALLAQDKAAQQDTAELIKEEAYLKELLATTRAQVLNSSVAAADATAATAAAAAGATAVAAAA